MQLMDVYTSNSHALLYELLGERQPYQNISHRAMPTWEEHVAFINSKPYREWYLIINDEGYCVGATYLSKQNEIGVGIFSEVRRKGYGQWAVIEMVRRHRSERLLANINPDNAASHAMFSKLGFQFIQVTFERRPTR